MNDNYKNFIEAKIYLDEKDGNCNYTNDLRRKYPEYLGLVDFAKVYRRIVNYRIKKYGTSKIGCSIVSSKMNTADEMEEIVAYENICKIKRKEEGRKAKC